MAAYYYHARSNSFPSTQHPLVSEFDHQLIRLRSAQEASISSTSIACKLSGLQDLHDCVDQLLSLPLNRQALCGGQNEKRVDELLDGSLRILDACSAAKNALVEIKDSAQELQSTLRRRRVGESDLARQVKKFLASRKMVKRTIQKATENRRRSFKGEKCDEIVSMLGEVESITLAVFESLFSFMMSEPKSQKSTSWSLVSKLMISKRVVCEEVNELNEFESAHVELKSLVGTKKCDGVVEGNVEKKLQKLEKCIQDLEDGVENLYRSLIKTQGFFAQHRNSLAYNYERNSDFSTVEKAKKPAFHTLLVHLMYMNV